MPKQNLMETILAKEGQQCYTVTKYSSESLLYSFLLLGLRRIHRAGILYLVCLVPLGQWLSISSVLFFLKALSQFPKTLVYTFCLFLWCKYALRGQFEVPDSYSARQIS